MYTWNPTIEAHFQAVTTDVELVLHSLQDVRRYGLDAVRHLLLCKCNHPTADLLQPQALIQICSTLSTKESSPPLVPGQVQGLTGQFALASRALDVAQIQH